MAEEHGFDLGESEEPKTEVKEHTISGLNPVESEEPKVEVEDTENIAYDERHKAEAEDETEILELTNLGDVETDQERHSQLRQPRVWWRQDALTKAEKLEAEDSATNALEDNYGEQDRVKGPHLG